MLKCIIVDDNKKDRENLRLLLSSYCTDVNIVAEAHDKISLKNALENHQVDLVFLDIHLGPITCFEIIEEMDWDELDFKLVFVTASEKHAIKGYKYNAIDYILKPIHTQELIETVNKVHQSKNQKTSKKQVSQEFDQLYSKITERTKISISDGKKIHVLEVNDIIYCSAKGNYTLIKLIENKEIVISKKLKYFEENLQLDYFVRIHKSFLINLSHIKSLSKSDGISVFMSDGQDLPVSRNSKDELFSKMNII